MHWLISALASLVLYALAMPFLRRRFPPGAKPYPSSWYEARCRWLDRGATVAFLLGLFVGLYLYRATLKPTDPRGCAVGFFLGALLSVAFICGACSISGKVRLRDWWDYNEAYYGVRNVVALAAVIPIMALSAYGTAHLLLYGP